MELKILTLELRLLVFVRTNEPVDDGKASETLLLCLLCDATDANRCNQATLLLAS